MPCWARRRSSTNATCGCGVGRMEAGYQVAENYSLAPEQRAASSSLAGSESHMRCSVLGFAWSFGEPLSCNERGRRLCLSLVCRAGRCSGAAREPSGGTAARCCERFMVAKLGIDKLRGELSCACLRTYIDKRAYVLFVPNTNLSFFF